MIEITDIVSKVIAGAAIVVAIVWAANEYAGSRAKEVKKENAGDKIWPSNEDEAEAIAKRNTEIMKGIMRELGSEPVSEEGDGEYSFRASYQGETFAFDCSIPYVKIFDQAWGQVNVNSATYGITREAMNEVNCKAGHTMVMTRPNEDGVRYLHSHDSFLMHPDCYLNKELVRGELEEFFRLKNNMNEIYRGLLEAQMQEGKDRRPVGFATGSAEEEPVG